MIHPDTEVRLAGEAVGLGVFAVRPIPRGTIVWVLDELDQRLPIERVRALSLRSRQLLDRYGFLDETGARVLCWDAGRFVNHACTPNVLPTGWGFEIAVRDLAEGEELTNDYATLNLERPFACHCGGPACRGRVRPGDFERLAADWDRTVRAALPDAGVVAQPLWPWVAGWRRVRRGFAEPARMPTVASLRCVAAREDPLAYAAIPRRRRRPVALEDGPVPAPRPERRRAAKPAAAGARLDPPVGPRPRREAGAAATRR